MTQETPPSMVLRVRQLNKTMITTIETDELILPPTDKRVNVIYS